MNPSVSSLIPAPPGLRAVWATDDGARIRAVLALGVHHGLPVPIVAYGGELRPAHEPWLVLTADEPDPTDDEVRTEFLDDHPDHTYRKETPDV